MNIVAIKVDEHEDNMLAMLFIWPIFSDIMGCICARRRQGTFELGRRTTSGHLILCVEAEERLQLDMQDAELEATCKSGIPNTQLELFVLGRLSMFS